MTGAGTGAVAAGTTMLLFSLGRGSLGRCGAGLAAAAGFAAITGRIAIAFAIERRTFSVACTMKALKDLNAAG